jgi:hypothetical protein
MDTDVALPLLVNMHQQADHAIEKGFAADKAMIGAHLRLSREMFAATEADLQIERAIVSE